MAATITFKFQGGSSGGGRSAKQKDSSFTDRFQQATGGGFLEKYTKSANVAATVMGGQTAGIASALGAAGPYGAAIAASVSAFKALTDTVTALDGRFMKMASDIAPYSAAVSAAQANNEVKDILHNINRAERFGESSAAYTSARGDLGRAFETLADEITEPIMEMMVPVMETLTPVILEMAEIVKMMQPFFEGVTEWLIKPFLEVVKAILAWFGFDVREREKDKEPPFNVNEWLDRLGGGMPRTSFDQLTNRIPLNVTLP